MKTDLSNSIIEYYLTHKVCMVQTKLKDKTIMGNIIGYFYEDTNNNTIWKWHINTINKNGEPDSIYILNKEVVEMIIQQ